VCFYKIFKIISILIFFLDQSDPLNYIRIIFVGFGLIILHFESHHKVKISQVHCILASQKLPRFPFNLRHKILLFHHTYCFAGRYSQQKRNRYEGEKSTDSGANFGLAFKI